MENHLQFPPFLPLKKFSSIDTGIRIFFHFFLTLAFCFLSTEINAQQTVFTENFNSPPLSPSYSTASNVSSTLWNIERSGDDMGARINGGILDLTNNATGTTNSNGWIFAYRYIYEYGLDGLYQSHLQDNQGIVTWKIKIRQEELDPSGFRTTTLPYGKGVAYVLASTSQNVNSAGDGYAIVLGSASSLDQYTIVRYHNGLKDGQTVEVTDDYIICNGGCIVDCGTEYFTLEATYNPQNNGWTLSGTASSVGFNDPNQSTYPKRFGIDATYTASNMGYMGCYWQSIGGTTSKRAFFDDISIQLSPYGPSPQSLNLVQNFGSLSFNLYPSAFVGWGGFNGAAITTQALAEATSPAINATLFPKSGAFTTEPSGGLYGYAASSNGKIAIATSEDGVNGLNQPVAGVSKGAGITSILVKYDMEVLRSGVRPLGMALQYKNVTSFYTGSEANWQTIPGTVQNFGSNPVLSSVISKSIQLSVPSTAYQYYFRWITWRPAGAGSNTTIGLDNINFSAPSVSNFISISSNSPSTGNVLPSSTNVILQRIDLSAVATATTATLTGLKVATKGSYSGTDLTNLKVRYSTDNVLSVGDPTLSTKSTSLEPGVQVFPSFSPQLLPAGSTGYLFITADIAPAAYQGNSIYLGSTSFDDITISNSTKLGTSPLPEANSQTIIGPPVLSNSPSVSNITTTSVTIGQSILTAGGLDVTKWGFYYSTTNGFANGTGTEVSTTGIMGAGNFSNNGTGLIPNTVYYFKSFAVNSQGTTYSSQGSFTTLKSEPTNIPTLFACGSSTTTTIPLTWVDATGSVVPDGYLIRWSSVSYAAILSPIDGTPVADGTFAKNVGAGVQNFTPTTLSLGTTYFFKIFSYTNSGSGINYLTSSFGQTSCATMGYIEDFEIGSVSSYATGDYNCRLGSWAFNDTQHSVSGPFSLDEYNGGQSIRIRNLGSVSMNFDLPTGISSVSLQAAKYGFDGNSQWRLEASNNGGSSWAYSSPIQTTASGSFITHTFPVNLSGSVRIRVVKTAFANRLNIDDITITPMCNAPSTTGSITLNNITSTGADASWTNAAGNGTLVVLRPTATSSLAPVQGTAYTPVTLDWNTTSTINANNRVLFKGAGSSVSGITGLSPETEYTATAYNYFTANNCYQSAFPASNSFFTLSLPPIGHAASFTALAVDFDKISLSFSPASSIPNADGYILLQRPAGAPTGLPENGVQYSDLDEIGDATVVKIINSLVEVSAQISGLSSNLIYHYVLIPFSWDGSNPKTLNYNLSPTIPFSSDTTFFLPSVNSDILSDPIFPYTSDIDYASFQNITASTLGNSVAVFRIIVRDGAGDPDVDLLPTILDSLTIYVPHQNAIRAAALFGGENQDVFLQSGIVGADSILFVNLHLLGGNISVPDGEFREFTLRITFKASVTDNHQLRFHVAGAGTNAFLKNSSRFSNFLEEASSTFGNRNRLEVYSTTLTINGTSGVPVNTKMFPFEIRAVDALGSLDLDQSSCQVVLTKGTGVLGTMTAPGSPYTFSSGKISVEDIQFNTEQSGATMIATPQSCMGATPVKSLSFNVLAEPYSDGDFQSATGGGLSWTNANHWRRRNSGIWGAYGANGTPLSTSKVFIQGSMTISSSSSCARVEILSGGNLSINNTFSVTGAVIVADGGTLTILNDFSRGGVFEIQDYGTVILNFAATNASNLWTGFELFKAKSTFIIRNWAVSAPVVAQRPVFNGTSINTSGPLSSAFGNLIIDLSTNLGAPLYLMSNLISNYLTSGNLILRSTNPSQQIYLGAARFTSGVGGNLVVDGLYNSSGFMNFGLDDFTLTVNGNMVLNAATTRFITDANCRSANLNIKGNLSLNSTSSFQLSSLVLNTSIATINLEGDLTVASGATINNLSPSQGIGKYRINFSGSGDGSTAALTQEVDIASASTTLENVNTSFRVNAGAFVQLKNSNIELGQNSELTVKNGGIFDFGFSSTNVPLFVGISGTSTGTKFNTEPHSTLKISSPDGINTTGTLGNVRTLAANRIFSQVGTFWFIGKTNQVTGTAILNTSSSKNIICDLGGSLVQLEPTNNLVLPLRSRLEIRNGIFREKPSATISGDGFVTMEGGVFSTEVSNATVPQLTDYARYGLNAGVVELSGTTNQVLASEAPFYDLSINGPGTKTLTGDAVINHNLRISIGTLDVSTNRMTGSAGITMTAGLLRMDKSEAALYPELTGISTPYTISGGKIELYGTIESSDFQTIRSIFGPTSIPINYFDIDLNSSQSNFSTQNISIQSSLNVSGTLNVNKPTVLNLDNNKIVNGTGSFFLNDGAVLKYAHPDGITPASCGTGLSCGQIRTNSRTFSENATYWINGNEVNMTAGTGMPSNIHTLITTRAGNPVTLSQDVRVRYFVGIQDLGMLNTGPFKIILDDTATIQEMEVAHVVGKVETTRNLNLDPHSFGGLGLEVDADGNLPGQTHVVRHTGILVPGAEAEAIKRRFSITPTVNTGLNATLSVKYFNDEINGLDENNFQFYRSTNTGVTWLPQTSSTFPDDNLVVRSGINSFSEWTIGDINVPLPMSVLSFYGKAGNGRAELFWITDLEQNVEGYFLSRSVDGIDFQSIAFVDAYGANAGRNEYVKTDLDFDRSYYYKLTLLQKDGKKEDCRPIFLDCKCGEGLRISIFPNPNNGKVTLRANQILNSDEMFDFQVVGMDGRILFATNANIVSLETQLNEKLQEFSSGLYQTTISNNRYRETIRLRKF